MKCSSGELTNMQVLKPTGGPIGLSEVAAHPGQHSLVLRGHAPVDRIGVDVLIAMAKLADLDAFAGLGSGMP